MDLSGSEAIAHSLKQLGVRHIFGIVGIPVIEVAEACRLAGIQFIAFRNEQAATYAASIYGYLTGVPGVALVVGGPGVVHALAGVENANVNRFPLLLLAGSAETRQKAMGAFQQLDQVSLLRSFGTKFAEQPSSLADLPRLMEQAYRQSYFGKPGTSYIDLPADLIQSRGQVDLTRLGPPGPAPQTLGDPQRIAAAVLALKEAKHPLLIVGKGCAYARAETAVRALQSRTGISFLPTPMGKGVIPDSSDANMSAARSQALRSADVILVLGARLNWILHYGKAPKFSPEAKIFQVDSVAEELGNNGGCTEYSILGDVQQVTHQLAAELAGWRAPAMPRAVLDKRQSNERAASLKERPQPILEYRSVYKVIRDTLAENVDSTRKIVYVSEGANTMDVSRTSFPLDAPRTRLDAGTNATMGIGMGYAIAAKAADPSSLVVAIEGDSAFGFSGMELETAVRTNLPMIVYVMNNSGVYHGSDPALYRASQTAALPTTALSLETKYHVLAEGLGAKGFLARTLDEVRAATEQALTSESVTLINVIIDPAKDKKLEFGWMSSAKI